MAKKTISGARTKRGQRSNGCNPAHNNRDYLPSNADPNRQHLNEFFVESTQAITIEQIYEKLFQESYEEWLKKDQAKGRSLDAPEKYIDKIRNSPDKKNKKREQYEIIWGIGDMKNTGWKSNRSDFSAARILLHDFAEHLQTLPEIEFATPGKINDPNWQPKNDCCLIVTNLALHGDEHTPQLHMDFIPYRRGAKRGQRIQNAYAAAFEGMGYAVKTQEMVDEHGDPVYKKDRDGNVIYKKNKDGSIMCNDAGEPIPEPVIRKESFGSIEWIEKQKQWIADRMMERHGWEREYKGKNKFGDVTISEFIVEDNKRIIEEQEQQIQKAKENLSFAFQKHQELQTLNEKNLKIIEANNETIAEQAEEIVNNDVWLEEQADLMDLYHNHEEYLEGGQKVQEAMDDIQEDLNELPVQAKLFHAREAENWRERAIRRLHRMMDFVKYTISKLQIFEKQYPDEATEQLSVPAQKRAAALDDVIANAAQKADQRSEPKSALPEQIKAYYREKDLFWNEYHQAQELAAEELRQVYRSEELRGAFSRYKQAQHLVKNSAGIITLGLSVAALIMTKVDLKREQQRAEKAKELQQELRDLCQEAVNLNVVQRNAYRRNQLTDELEREILEQQAAINNRLKEIQTKQSQPFSSSNR